MEPVMSEMMKQCADAAAANMVDAMVDDDENEEDKLLIHFSMAVQNFDDKLNKKMTNGEVQMQAQGMQWNNDGTRIGAVEPRDQRMRPSR